MVELETLLYDRLPSAVSNAKVNAQTYRDLRCKVDRSTDEDEDLEQKAEHADDLAGTLLDLMWRMLLLVRRVCSIRRRAPVWRQLVRQAGDLGMDLAEVSAATAYWYLNDADWQAKWKAVDDRMEILDETVRPLAVLMIPPPANRLQAWIFARRLERHDRHIPKG